MANTDTVILNSALVTIASTVGFSFAPKSYGGNGEFPAPKLLIGTGLAFMGLSILGDAAPGVAGPLSVAVAVTAFTYYGLPVLDKAFGADSNKKEKKKK